MILTKTSIEEAVARIFNSRQITRNDQRMLMTLLSQGSLTQKDEAIISRVYEALHQGRLRVVD